MGLIMDLAWVDICVLAALVPMGLLEFALLVAMTKN
jgi:hypothetical protein